MQQEELKADVRKAQSFLADEVSSCLVLLSTLFHYSYEPFSKTTQSGGYFLKPVSSYDVFSCEPQLTGHGMNFSIKAARQLKKVDNTVDAWTGDAGLQDTTGMIEVFTVNRPGQKQSKAQKWLNKAAQNTSTTGIGLLAERVYL